MVHRINLRNPWQRKNPDQTLPLPLPSNALLPSSDSILKITRRFHRPSGLTATHQVELVLEGLFPTASLQLNGQPLQMANGPEKTFRGDITANLESFNQLTVCWTGFDQIVDCQLEDVYLEISESAG